MKMIHNADGCQPTALEDPWTIVEEFRNAAHKAKQAGFDGVECQPPLHVCNITFD